MTKTYPFYLSTAFASDPFAGNPAAIVFIDNELAEDTDTLLKLGANLSQPMSVMIYPSCDPSSDPKLAKFRVRFFSDNWAESGICGHGTLAAAGVMFTKPGILPACVEVVELQTLGHGSLRAMRKDDGWFEIQLVAAGIEELPAEDYTVVKAALDRAYGRDVKVKSMVRGKGAFSYYLLVELHVEEDLKGSTVKVDAFRNTGYTVNIVTTESPTGEEAFLSRMFSPELLQSGEDHVCGSAHSLLIPYWASKGKFNREELVKARQVSFRGGALKILLEEAGDVIHLQGQATVFVEGNI
ncbi:Diaminopimelate epimerase-like protein, partial [Hymenopellis radicata]